MARIQNRTVPSARIALPSAQAIQLLTEEPDRFRIARNILAVLKLSGRFQNMFVVPSSYKI